MPVFTIGRVQIVSADERTMLTMKLRASRGQRDAFDIAFLVKQCGLHSSSEIHDLHDEYFPEDPMPTRAKPLLENALRVGNND